MKLWLIIMFLGKNVMVVGPLPDMLTCLAGKQHYQ